MNWGEFFETAARGGGKLALIVFLILVPLMVALEFLRQTKALNWMVDKVHPAASRIGFQKEALVPLLAGFIFGISYGAGVLIPEARKKHLAKEQIFLVAVFLALCHAVVEDTLLFMAVGANGLYLVLSRFILAVLATLVGFKLYQKLKGYRSSHV